MTIGRIPSVEGGIQPTIVDAKGDLIAGVAADSVNRLAVGSNDQVLVADSAASTGMAWKSYGFQAENPVLNSGFDVWQRGTSFNSTGTNAQNYTADRWINYNTGTTNVTVSRQATGDTTNLPFIQYCARVQRNSGNTNTNEIWMAQVFETANSIPLAGKTVTLSFYARRGSNYSAASNVLNVQMGYGTGTDQALNGGVLSNSAFSGSATLTTTWQRFTVTGSIPAAATQLCFYIYEVPVGTASTNDYYEITGVQIDVGSVATPYKRAMNTLQGELAACQRYYERITRPSIDQPIGLGAYYSTTACYVVVPYKVPKRTTTNFTASGTGIFTVYSNGGSRVTTNVVADQLGDNFASINLTTSAATAGHAALVYFTTASSYVDFSSEL